MINANKLSSFLFYILISLILSTVNVNCQTNFSVEVSKINYSNYSPPVPDGLFTINFTPGSQRTYLSIGATNNSTQQFGIIVSNMLLPSSMDTQGPMSLSTTFDFSKICAPPYLAQFALTIYIHILTSPGFYPFDPSTWMDTKTVTVNEVVNNAKGVEGNAVTTVPIAPVVRPGQTVGNPLSDYQYRPDAPNLDLNNSQNGISATYAGDLNACVPTATANSIKWAQSKYSDINLPADMDLRKTERTLSGLMKRKNGEGTYTDKMLAGKLDFMEQYNLPMEVKYQSFEVKNPIGVGSTSGKSIARSFNPKTAEPKPTWDFLKKMMKNGEDVEMNFTWYDTTDKKWYGHSVNVTGINEWADGTKKVAFKHDRNQDGAGGLIEEVQQITVDAQGWMRFGEKNQYFIKDVVAESPVIQEGRETAAWLNELFTDAAPRKVIGNLATSQFVEVALKSSVTDLNNYTVTMYDGKTGASYATYTLDQFTVGSTSNGLTLYYKDFSSNNLLGPPAGVAISHTGAVIQNQFISYGGSFVATDGDATGLTSTDIGMIPTTASVQLSGNGTSFSQFSFNYGTPSPGTINTDQNYSAQSIAKVNLVSPANLDKNKSGAIIFLWNKTANATKYQLQISRDQFFLSNILYDNSNLTDTSYSFTNSNLEGAKIYWRVKAIGTNINGAFSSIYSFSNKLNTPSNLIATSSSSKNNLTWTDNSTSETGYSIERKDGNASSSNNYSVIQNVAANSVSYSDQNVTAGSTYTYRIRATNANSESDYSNTATVSTVTAVEKNDKLPTEYKLEQNYPNPFNPITIITYSIPENTLVQIKIFDLLGNVVNTLVNEFQNAGYYSITFNGGNLSSGIYFYQLKTAKYINTKKLMLIK